MSDFLENILKIIESGSVNQARLRERLAGKVHYGTFAHDPSVAARINEDGTETFGRFLKTTGEFVPFGEEEDAEFKRRFAWFFTKIFNKNNVVQFPARKRTQT
jgi:hypothetical protein